MFACFVIPGIVVLVAREPVETLALVGGFAVLAVCVLRVDVALLLVVGAVPLEAAFELSSNPQLTVTKITGALCFASFALYALSSGRRLVFDRSHALLLLLLALALVSTLQAQEIDAALVTTLRYASFVALYIVVSQFVGDHLLQRRIVWTLSLASSGAALLALWEFFSGPEGTFRATLPYGDPNDLAFVLATTLPLTLWLLRERRLLRPLAAAMIVVIALGIVFTYSRGALLGLGVGIVWLAFTERRRIPMLILAALVTVAAGVIFVGQDPSRTLRLEEGFRAKDKVAAANVDARLEAWGAAANLAGEHPLLGVGPGNFRYHFAEATKTPEGTQSVTVVHNAYLDVAAELGLIALALFLMYIVGVFLRLTSARRQGSGPPGLAAAVRTAFVVGAVAATTLSEQYYAPLWLLGALATALWAESRAATPVSPRRGPGRLTLVTGDATSPGS